jgi:hypothetical protein
MNNQRLIAKLTGFGLVLMALTAGFSFGFAYPKFFDLSQLEFAQKNITENIELYKLMLSGILLIIILDLLVSWTLYQYFKNDDNSLAFFSLIFRIIYTVLFCIATYYLTLNLESNTNKIVTENYESFDKIWSSGLLIFGIHLLIIGQLMKLHQLIPIILWCLTIIAGTSYILVHSIKIIFPELTEVTETLNTLLGLPMALGELGLAIWLIVKGGKIKFKVKPSNFIETKNLKKKIKTITNS